MIKSLLSTVAILFSFLVMGQKTLNQWVEEGIQYHDAGNYEDAVQAYKNALSLDPNSALAHYEIAMTYMYMAKYDSSLMHAQTVIDLDDEHLLPAYMTKGNSQDALGQPKEAIKTYKEALKKFGGHYLMHYNLALTLYNTGNLDEAKENLVQGIYLSTSHSSSHYLLGRIMYDQKNKVESILALHYFLLLEPNSQRSGEAFQLLKTQMYGGAEKTGENEINLTLSPAAADKKNEFGPAELMLSLLAASNFEKKNEKKSEDELFRNNTESMFKILGELKKKKNKGLWWEHYVPFFYELAKTKHLETYCYYITQSSSQEAADWLAKNDQQIAKFGDWISEF